MVSHLLLHLSAPVQRQPQQAAEDWEGGACATAPWQLLLSPLWAQARLVRCEPGQRHGILWPSVLWDPKTDAGPGQQQVPLELLSGSLPSAGLLPGWLCWVLLALTLLLERRRTLLRGRQAGAKQLVQLGAPAHPAGVAPTNVSMS